MKLLFVCTANCCRSQMAEGWARAIEADAYSAGTEPAGYVHPLAVQVMAEKGIDLSTHTSKKLDLDFARTMDVVITVCDAAEQQCPVISGVQCLHWSIPDPAKATGTQKEVLNQFRAVRDDLARRVEEFFTERMACDGAGASDNRANRAEAPESL